MKNVMPMQPYLVLDTDDYEVKKEMKSGISHFYEFSKKKNSKVEMKAVPDGSVDLLFGIGEQDVKTYIGGTVLAAKGWEFEDGRSYMIPMDAFVSGSWQRKPDIRNVISGVFFSRCMEFRQRILNGLSGFRSCCMS